MSRPPTLGPLSAALIHPFPRPARGGLSLSFSHSSRLHQLTYLLDIQRPCIPVLSRQTPTTRLTNLLDHAPPHLVPSQRDIQACQVGCLLFRIGAFFFFFFLLMRPRLCLQVRTKSCYYAGVRLNVYSSKRTGPCPQTTGACAGAAKSANTALPLDDPLQTWIMAR